MNDISNNKLMPRHAGLAVCRSQTKYDDKLNDEMLSWLFRPLD